VLRPYCHKLQVEAFVSVIDGSLSLAAGGQYNMFRRPGMFLQVVRAWGNIPEAPGSPRYHDSGATFSGSLRLTYNSLPFRQTVLSVAGSALPCTGGLSQQKWSSQDHLVYPCFQLDNYVIARASSYIALLERNAQQTAMLRSQINGSLQVVQNKMPMSTVFLG
jgi:hypothetical protein